MTTQITESSIDDFVFGLDYDPKVILAVAPEGDSPMAQPEKDRKLNNDSVIIVTRTRHKLTKNLSDVALLRPTAGAIYTGALVIADANLADGQPTPVGLPRAKMTISVDLPGLNPSEATVDSPTNASVQAAVTKLVDSWMTQTTQGGYVNPARSFLEITTASSTQQAALKLGVNAKWASGNASAQLDVSHDSDTQTLMAFYKQVFYTVTIDVPASPSAFFAPQVQSSQLSRVLSAEHPPAYVRSVDFGRIIMIKMTTSTAATTADVKAAFQQATQAASGGVDLEAKYSNILKQSTFQVLAIGGGSDTAATFTGATDVPSKLAQYIVKDAGLRPGNPGVPISYNVAFMKDNSLATMGFTTDYTETTSEVKPNGFIKVQHSGGYVAAFDVTWSVQGEGKSWASGKKTAGWGETLQLPGDAENLHIKAIEWTGLVWQPTREAMNLRVPGPTNKTYTIKGTTLNPAYQVS